MKSSVVTDRIKELLAQAPAFDRLPEEVRDGLLPYITLRYFEAEEVVLEQGQTTHEYLYIVESGSVRLTELESGRLVDEYGEGEVFGNYGVIRGGALPFEVRVVESAVCLLLPIARFQEIYEAHESFAAFFNQNIRAYISDREGGDSGEKSAFDAAGARLLFGTTLGELVGRSPVLCEVGATAREAAETMREQNADSVVVVRDGEVVGILTDIDLRNKLVAEAAPADTPVEELMSRHVLRLGTEEPVFKALMEMMHHRAYHVVVSDDRNPDGPGQQAKVLGVISDQDISRAQGASPTFLTERIEEADSVEEFTGLRKEADQVLVNLERQGVQAEDLISINTEFNDRLMRRIISLVEGELKEFSPEMEVDLPWSWLSLGSEGRGEMSLVTDQDNALIYADPSGPEEAEKAETWFRTLAERANAALADAGFALCKGDIMARNPRWRQPASEWHKTFRQWILSPDREALMLASTFFDLRGLYGDFSLVKDLKSSISEALEKESRFLPFMAQNALSHRPPLSFFRRFVLERSGAYRHTFNIKRRGLRPIVDSARVLAVDLKYLDSANTVDRLRYAAREIPSLKRTLDDALDSYYYLSELRLKHHLRAIDQGESADNQINPSSLTGTQQSILKVVFANTGDVQDAVSRRYGLDPRL